MTLCDTIEKLTTIQSMVRYQIINNMEKKEAIFITDKQFRSLESKAKRLYSVPVEGKVEVYFEYWEYKDQLYYRKTFSSTQRKIITNNELKDSFIMNSF